MIVPRGFTVTGRADGVLDMPLDACCAVTLNLTGCIDHPSHRTGHATARSP